MAQNKAKVFGYLPDDQPPWGQMVLLGFQHVLTMFPATVLVALLVGFDVGTVLAVSGLATITALILSKVWIGQFIPLYYGSSFSYITATITLTGAAFGTYAGKDLVSLAQVGIVATGIINIGVGFLISAVGKDVFDKILPPVLTGSVALVIGVTLGGAAMDMASANWAIAIVTLIATVAFSVYLQGKGFIGLLPILLGALVGYLFSALFYSGQMDYSGITSASFIRVPKFTLPAFGSPRALESIAAIAIIAIATIPESTAHLYQISLYVDKLADDLGKPRYHLDKNIGKNLVLDGIGDFINGMFGGVAGTNYGENNSLMAITRNYSGPVLIAAGVIAILLGFIGTLAAVVSSVPLAVTGGLAIYLFGVIGMQGIALIQSEEVDLFDPRQLAIGAVVTVVAIGAQVLGGGNVPLSETSALIGVFPNGLPGIATGAVAGILLNLIFMFFPAENLDK
ncbi:MAG: solute carrier family 23 protein [Chloroflexota bacterium]|nr:solute carrier family 23 protein [Chloroflexota bacterium]